MSPAGRAVALAVHGRRRLAAGHGNRAVSTDIVCFCARCDQGDFWKDDEWLPGHLRAISVVRYRPESTVARIEEVSRGCVPRMRSTLKENTVLTREQGRDPNLRLVDRSRSIDFKENGVSSGWFLARWAGFIRAVGPGLGRAVPTRPQARWSPFARSSGRLHRAETVRLRWTRRVALFRPRQPGSAASGWRAPPYAMVQVSAGAKRCMNIHTECVRFSRIGVSIR